MTRGEWEGEIVSWRGQLWTVESVSPGGGLDVWLNLVDHYGSGDTEQVLAGDVEVALQ